jgi:hypothetical protein
MIAVQVGEKTECKICGFYLFLDSIVNLKKKKLVTALFT